MWKIIRFFSLIRVQLEIGGFCDLKAIETVERKACLMAIRIFHA
jgi:hypothetical protein